MGSDSQARVEPVTAGPGGNWLALAAVAALFTWAFASRVALLLETPTPLGIDGYYYAIQVRALLEEGRLHYPSLPLAFWWLTPFAALTEPVRGVKLGAVAGTAAIVFPLFLLVRRLSGSRSAGVVAAALVATSSQSFYLSSEFVKQGLGLTLVACFLATLAAALDQPTRLRVAGVLVWLGLSLLTHKLAAGVALLVGTAALAMHAWRSRAQLPRRLRWLLAAVAGIAACFALGMLLAPQRMLGAQGLSLLTEAFQAQADGSVATLKRPSGVQLFLRREVLWGGIAALLLSLHAAFWPAGPRAAPGAHKLPPVAFGLVLLAALTAFPGWDVSNPEGLGMRLRLTAFLAFAPCAALLFARLLAGRPWGAALMATCAAVVLPVLLPPHIRHAGARVPGPYLQALHSFQDQLRPDALVITTQRSLAFMVTWHTRARALRSVPASLDPTRTYRLLPKADVEPVFAAALERHQAASLPGTARRDRAPLVLLSESSFQQLLAELPPEVRRRWSAWPNRLP
jgi:hypothetical protein